jgi:hypothetical protein
MPPTKQKKQTLQDGQELTLGVLYLLDNAPDPPEDMSWHEYSEWAIADHLKRHSYYYHSKGKRTLVDVAKMRGRIANIYHWNTKAPIPKLGKGFKDKTDYAFGNGGTDLLNVAFLDRQGYEKGKFPENRLNKHVSEEIASGNAKIDGRPDDETSEKTDESDASKTSSHDVDEEEHRESEPDPAAPSSVQPTLPSPSSHQGTPLQPPRNSITASESNMVDDRQRCEQTGIMSDEQLSPSQDEGQRLRSSVDPQAQTLDADNATSCSKKNANATSSEAYPETQVENVLGAKRKPTQDHGPHKRQCQTKDATHQDKSNVLKLRLKAPTPAKQPSEPPPTIDASKSLETPQNAIAARENQAEPCLAILSLDEQARNMQSLYGAIQKATDAVLLSIGPIRHIPSPLHPESSGLLRDLYARCWGQRWEEVRVRQVVDHVFTTPQVTASLLSAFLYDRVLNPRVQLKELVSNVLEMGGSVGEALLEEFDIVTRGQSDHFSNEHANIELTRFRYHNHQESTHYRSTKSLLQVSTRRRDPPTAIEAGSRQPRQ